MNFQDKPSVRPFCICLMPVIALLTMTSIPQFTFAQPAPINLADKDADSIPVPADAQTAEELFEFMDGLGEMEPEGKSDEEVIDHQKKIFRTVLNAANKILTMEITNEQAVEASFYRLQALQYLRELGEPGAPDLFGQAIQAALADERPEVNDIGMKFNIELGLGMWNKLDEAQRNEVIDSLIAFVTRGTPDGKNLQMVMSVVDFLGDRGGSAQAKRLLDATIPIYKNSDDPDLQQIVPMLEGIARRMALPGNPILVEGTLLDGTKFDWSSYRGKVVLVDFWATWCGPCRAEVPNVLKLYEAYHGKGFDVVGISLDEKREQAQSYIQQTGIPWVTIFSENDAQRGWEQPLAVYYGITGIPRAILVDQAGKVVSMNARGPILERELRKLLGEPQASHEASPESQTIEVAKPVLSD
ncbi:TlpA family protein disulfide reductase [Bythopirellula polymerisocia]|uniref:Thiol-disulfide oxidoreductase ResA n=1 Tax=Bythopirellula polymerisocia TaxID=2528003 RepID=A0A5C6CUV3_9BACT|nr:TlpA disulfide reductase family protein [Bythopirellula polymerisocia]TWU28208.1 Thiol-disulfide oxidoreductase ResA [Bythopirellula polymerisocia]